MLAKQSTRSRGAVLRHKRPDSLTRTPGAGPVPLTALGGEADPQRRAQSVSLSLWTSVRSQGMQAGLVSIVADTLRQ